MFSVFSDAGLDFEGDLIAPFCATADRDLVFAILPMYVRKLSTRGYEV